MRILIACEFYHPSIGGVQEVMRQVAERLVERGHQVTVATKYLAERKGRQLNGVSIRGFRVSGNLVYGMEGEVEAYKNFVLGSDYDVLMIKAAQQWTFDALIPVLDRITTRKIFIPCGFSSLYEAEYQVYYRELPNALKKFDRLIFYASNYRDINFARNHDLSKLTVIPNGASKREFNREKDPDFRKRQGIAKDALVLLTVGSLTGMKGHREVLGAFELAELSVAPAVLILNGNETGPSSLIGRLVHTWRVMKQVYRRHGSLRAAKWLIRPWIFRARLGWLLKRLGYRAIPPELPLKERVRRLNRTASGKRAVLVNLPRDELIQAYLNSDLFVFASNIEYSPLVLFEAAAAGLPFISVPVGNAEEIARWTGAGEICPAKMDERGYIHVDPADLAGCISMLASNAEKRKAYATAGRRSWDEHFTWEKISAMYEQALMGNTIGNPVEQCNVQSIR